MDAPVNARPPDGRTVTRVMDVLDLFGTVHAELTLSEISRRLGMPKSSAHNLLRAMHRRGYLAWDADTKGFSLGLRVMALAQGAPLLRVLQQRAGPHMERLAVALRETVMLGAFEGDSVVCVATVESPDPIRFAVRLGERRPLHCTSLGKLYLAALSDMEVRNVMKSSDMTRETEGAITSIDELLTHLGEVRKAGYARNRAESMQGVYSVGVAIRGHGNVPIAGMSVVGVAERIAAKDTQIVEELVAAAQRLSRELGNPLENIVEGTG